MSSAPLLIGFLRDDRGKLRKWEVEPPESVTYDDTDPAFDTALWRPPAWRTPRARRLIFTYPGAGGHIYRISELPEEETPIFDALHAERTLTREDE
ncbi:MAG: hypothetical protein IJO71_09455 [Microbacterium sp.]|uniref:hypothetical protein n=1 Tax=Microbacterium sp. TaxID=51671 RepID=UPI0025DDFA62|nr:hypothetical protein [Microbacterium sp.]MBQ9917407.1 hypothetical protein [Microbacterium sp.]